MPKRTDFRSEEKDDEIEAFEVADILASLADKSLVIYDEVNARFHALESIRDYGADLLAEAGERQKIQRRHGDYFTALAEETEPKLYGPEQRLWRDRLEADHDNFRAALAGFATTKDGAGAALRLCAAIWWFWYQSGLFVEGRAHSMAALNHPGGQETTSARAKTVNGAGALAWTQGEYDAAENLFEQALALNRTLGDVKAQAANLHNLAMIAHARGKIEPAIRIYGESLVLSRQCGHRVGEATTLANLGMVTRDAGDSEGGKARLEEALKIYREMGNRNGEAGILGNLGLIAYGHGNYRAARLLLTRALGMNKEAGNGARQASNLHNLGLVSRELGDYDESLSLHKEALALWAESGDRQAIAECLEAMGGHASIRERVAEAARIWGAAERLREEIGAPILPGDEGRYVRDVQAARKAIGEDLFAAAWVEGRGITLDDIIECSMKDTDQ